MTHLITGQMFRQQLSPNRRGIQFIVTNLGLFTMEVILANGAARCYRGLCLGENIQPSRQ